MEHLIPPEFFDARSTWLLLLILAAAITILVKGADFLVDAAVGLSERLGVPKVIVGATIVSIGTTTPEAAVSVLAAFKGEAAFALGNSVGSVICDTGLIFGISCLLTRLPKDRFILNRHGWVQFGAGVLLVAVSLVFADYSDFQGMIPRSMGFVFIALLATYLYMSTRWARQHTLAAPLDKVEKAEKVVTPKRGETPMPSVPRAIFFLVLGLAMVLVSSHIALESVRVLCVRWGIPPSIVAATLIAFGTSLPELVTALMSIRKGHTELLIGNIIGADILNVLFVTGAAACAHPLTVEHHFFLIDFPAMIALLVLFRLCVWLSGKTFARWPGVIFIAIYLAFVATNYLTGHAR